MLERPVNFIFVLRFLLDAGEIMYVYSTLLRKKIQ
jgi:hypothetical protein